jgi:hypothetical protein
MSDNVHPLKQALLQSSGTASGSQWDRLSKVIGRSIDRARGVPELQSSARDQIDAAEYALNEIRNDLNAVMSKPVALAPQGQPTAPPASV